MNGRILSARRALVCVAVGAVAGTVAAVAVEPSLGPLVGWCTAGSPLWHGCDGSAGEGIHRGLNASRPRSLPPV